MKNIFRSILLSAVALTAGFAVSCTDPAPENGHYEGTPTISVSPASVTVPLAGGTTEAITVTTPAEWTLTIDAEDVVASTTAGNGDGVVTFEVPAVEAMRTIKVTFTATGYVSGFPITKKVSASISQTDTEVPSVDGPFVYYDNCGEAVSKVEDKWPYVDAYAGWNPTGGEGFDQSGVTYTGKDASVRNSGKSWAPVGATYATDAPYAYLQAKDGVEFIIHNINIKSGVKNYTFSFTAHNQYANMTASPYTPAPVSPLKSGENLTVEVSVDGQNWGAIAFTTMPDGNWTYAIAPFTLPADADKLFVRFSGYKADTTTPLPDTTYQYQAALRFDDFRLVEGGEGPVVDFNNAGAGGGEVVEGTIESILAGGEGSYSLKNAWVVATYGRGCLITDASGKYILCYMGTDKTIPAVGAVVEVNGAVTTYAGLLQFGDTAVVTATGETKSVDHGTAATMTGADLDAYVSAPAVKYASFEGALAISGTYYNVTVEGASTAVGSLSYPAGEIATQLSSLNGKGIKVTGYLIGVSSGKYTNMMVTAVSATGDDPEVPEAKTATMINKIASLTAGNYFMAAFLESYDTYNWAANPYHCWTGKTSTSNGKTDLETISYSYTDGVLAPGSGVLAYPAVVTLEAVDGKTNTYYIKVGDNYLTNTSAANRQLALGTTEAEWVAADQAKGGIIFTNNGATFGTANATKAHIRSYTDATSLAYGVVFFTTDGTVAPTPTPDPEPTPEVKAVTVAEFLNAAEDSTVYELTGVISNVTNTTYGNFDLTDSTGTVLIYGLCSPTGETKYWAASGAKEGDTITVQTVRSSYNGTAQGKNAIFVKLVAGDGGSTEPTPDPTPGGAKTIAEILALGNGAALSGTIEGVVVSNMALNNLTSKKGLYVQDETGALQFYLAANHELAFGTKVQIDLTGTTLGQYNGAVQVNGLALEKITTVSTDNTVEPKVVTIADFLANKYEGQYIAIEGVQVASADLTKTWVTGGAHTSINMEDAAGNKFVVFSSKYASYGAETVAQGSGTIKGISSINNGTMQIIFAQASDYASLTGERFNGTVTPEPEPTPDPEPVPGVTTTVSAALNSTLTWTEETDATYGKGFYTTVDGVKMGYYQATSTATAVAAKDDHIRVYKSSVFVVVPPAGQKVKSVNINVTYADTYALNMTVEGADSAVGNKDNGTITWSGSVDKFVATASEGQVRIKDLTIGLGE